MEQAQLSSGQSFQAGSVELRFLGDAPLPTGTKPVVRIVSAGAAPIPRPPPLPSAPRAPATPTYCKSHPRTAARFFCPQCQLGFCDLCVNTRQAVGGTGKFCRTCGTACTPLAIRPIPRAPADEAFTTQVGNAIYYPFKRDGLVLLTTGTLFLCLIKAALFLCQFAFLFGWIATLILSVYGTGYFTSFFRRIVTSSAAGEEAMPDWPDVTDFSGDILAPFFQLLGTVVASFLPAIVIALFVPAEFAYKDEATLAALVFAFAYFPMAFLAVSMLDSIAAANPLLVVQAISRMPLKYLLTVLIFGAVMVIRWAGGRYLPRYLPVPFLPAILSSFVGLYLLVILARILGLLHRDNRAKLGWFNH